MTKGIVVAGGSGTPMTVVSCHTQLREWDGTRERR